MKVTVDVLKSAAEPRADVQQSSGFDPLNKVSFVAQRSVLSAGGALPLRLGQRLLMIRCRK
jgi:hypothetical protein